MISHETYYQLLAVILMDLEGVDPTKKALQLPPVAWHYYLAYNIAWGEVEILLEKLDVKII